MKSEVNILFNRNDENKMTIFDVGANIGKYTEEIFLCFKQNSEIEVHCFEPSAITHEKLSENLRGFNVVINKLGLSDYEGEASLHFDKEVSGLASLYKRNIEYLGIAFNKEEKIKLTTIDEYCKKMNIVKIDMLKMDVEGNEYKVLLGASKMLNEKKIKAIQFEFGGCNIDSRTFFRDYWDILHDKYDFYKILSKKLFKISGYHEILEHFVNSNYYCVLK